MALRGGRLIRRVVGAVALVIAAAATPLLGVAGIADRTRDWVLFGLVLLAFGVGLGGLTWAQVRNPVAIFERGFAWWRGADLRWAYWDDVESVSAFRKRQNPMGFVPVGGTYIYRVKLRDGEQIKFTGDTTPHVHRLGEAIVEATMPRVLAEANDALARGDTVTFGPVSISEERGLALEGTLYPWDEIGALEYSSGYFHCRRKEARLRGSTVDVRKVPNNDAMWALVTALHGQHR